jgi:predicted RNA-binding Zn-ribbon protein involved in translation (DUF1610 family)
MLFPSEGHKIEKYPCPICGKDRLVRYSKKGKPYVTCNECGMQLFVRAEAGIKRMLANISESF